MTIQEDVPLAPLTTLQIGGPARYFSEAACEEEVLDAVAFASEHQLPLFVLGGGSNLVIADAGWPGLVLKIAIGGIPQHEEGEAVIFHPGAGVEWDKFVERAVANDCAGVECLSGIPGTVGGTPVQNVGAYGQEVSQTIEAVRAFDLQEKKIVRLDHDACRFRYRSSLFNTAARGRYIILRVTYRLMPGAKPSLSYADLQKHFAGSANPSLAELRDAVLRIRLSKGMLIVPGDADSRSAGSFFKNPILSESEFRDLAGRAEIKGLTIPSYPALEAHRKVSAAWLVEHSGFSKGFALGPAAISRKHALALINTGDARATDLVQLKEKIQRGVREIWGIELETEPVFVGM